MADPRTCHASAATLDRFEVSDPSALIAAADAGAALVHLEPDVERLVAHALEAKTWGTLSAASRALRSLAAFAREDGGQVPPRVLVLLGEVRGAMRQLRASPGPAPASQSPGVDLERVRAYAAGAPVAPLFVEAMADEIERLRRALPEGRDA